ncbi:MAG: 16S rRNA (cytosine(967)-C(5))-methyltransferase RsmB [Clostridia bacterium]|nr:16S rRNA (cytosine(967)-C(5))-methyltransferase RsmB [Clostridia bacterium]
MNARASAYTILRESERSDKYVAIALDSHFSSNEYSSEDRALISALVYGVTERRITLDYLISVFTGKKPSALDKEVLTILRLGMYQILYLEKIPDSAAVNESVKLASKYASRSKSFINAVLRRLCREKDDLPLPSDPIDREVIESSVPKELCLHFMKDYPDSYREIIYSANSRPRLTLTANTLRISRDALAASLKDSCELCEDSERGIRLTENLPISQFDELKNGLCYVQDEASQIAVSALGARAGETVIDVCACPGGKSFFAALSMENRGKIYAFDLHASKLSLIENQAARLGISIIEASEHDSTEPRADLIGKADRVICDLPCSGLGVLAKKPEIRHKSISELSELDGIQERILISSAKYLKVGGTLLYSTCTLRKAENEERILNFLKNDPDFSLLPFKVGSVEAPNGYTTLIPNGKRDGFFIAILKKTK